jgi:hypothetical protein
MKACLIPLLAIAVASAGQPKPVFELATEGVWTECAVLDPPGRHVALGRLDGGVVLVDAKDATIVGEWPAHGNNQVEQLDFSADGRRLLAVSPNRTIRLLACDAAPRVIFTWQLTEYYPAAGLAPDGRHVLLVASNGPLRWCDADSGKILREWRDPERPQGYTAACVLDNEGLAVVADFNGHATVVDAAAGQVLGRFGSRGEGPVGEWFHPPPGMSARRLGASQVVWPSPRLLAMRTNPAATPLLGETAGAGGVIGRAVTVSLPAGHQFFWDRAAKSPLAGWIEPRWDLLQAASDRGPAIVDPVHRRVWVQLPRGRWQIWNWSDLKAPDEFVIGSYAGGLRLMAGNLIWIEAANGGPTAFDWKAWLPRYLGSAAEFTLQPQPPFEETVAIELDSEGVASRWISIANRTAASWTLVHRDPQNGDDGLPLTTGFNGRRPGVRIGPGRLMAVYAEHPAQELAPGTDSWRIVPAIQLWDLATRKRLRGAFNDHREVGVADVRWSANGEWLATFEANGGSGVSRLRVYSVEDGRRRGPAEEYRGRMPDFAVGANGELVWVDENGIVRFRPKGGDAARSLTGPDDNLSLARVAISPDGSRVACLTRRNEIRVFAAADGALVRQLSVGRADDRAESAPSGGLLFVAPRQLIVVTSGIARIRRVGF